MATTPPGAPHPDESELDTLPIDYNFKYVTRYDRCTTCHQGIDRPAYSKEAISDLTKDAPAPLVMRARRPNQN